MNTPATTSPGALTEWWYRTSPGRGAAELVRFWPEPPLVRESDLALFGVERIDPAEEEFLRRLLSAAISRKTFDGWDRKPRRNGDRTDPRWDGTVRVAFDVDVIAGFEATNYSGTAD